ncbi:PaaX family transcriptional regulator [Kineococcus sp. SYSU DK005]|uniref:PaaX family transcriptional regulator n=1 Tax=Kineococcus sp. SYSU DK005 TaxID=3383126 RepID=UPI003D7E2156
MQRSDLPRARTGPEPQLLLTSLLGDFWYWRDEHIPSSALVRLLAEFGTSADGARAAMRRLASRGLLTVRRSGRATAYGIPARTAAVVVQRTHRLLTFGAQPPPWDGTWTVVTFSVPERARELRAALRARLRLLRFAALHDGVWVCPHDSAAAARALLDELGVRASAVLRASEVLSTTSSGLRAAFDLEPLAQEYREFTRRYEPLLAAVEHGRTGPAEALRARTELRVDWRRFPETDPDLPQALLPADWPRQRAQAVFVSIYDRLGPPAEARFREVLAQSDPELAVLARHHDSAGIAELFAQLGDLRPSGDTPFERAVEQRRLREASSR